MDYTYVYRGFGKTYTRTLWWPSDHYALRRIEVLTLVPDGIRECPAKWYRVTNAHGRVVAET